MLYEKTKPLIIYVLYTEVVIAPPGLFLLLVREHLKPGIEVCSQNVFDKPNGAFTGEISAEQLSDSKIGWALCGHSERRVVLGEEDGVREFSCSSHLSSLDVSGIE